MDELQIYPQWRQAVRDFLDEFSYGSVVAHSWLEAHFGMPSLLETKRMTAGDFSKRQFEWLANVEAFKAELLREHQVMLLAVRGEGYRWVHPHEQTKATTESFEKEVKKVFSSASQRLQHVRVGALSDDQQKENLDARAKLASLRGMTRKALK